MPHPMQRTHPHWHPPCMPSVSAGRAASRHVPLAVHVAIDRAANSTRAVGNLASSTSRLQIHDRRGTRRSLQSRLRVSIMIKHVQHTGGRAVQPLVLNPAASCSAQKPPKATDDRRRRLTGMPGGERAS